MIQVNQKGLDFIHAELGAIHKKGYDHFTDAMIYAWAIEVEKNYSENGYAYFEVSHNDTKSGVTEKVRLDELHYDDI